MKNFRFIFYAAVVAFMAVACDKDNPVIPAPEGGDPDYHGFFFLNEGQMGHNNASLEYFNLSNHTMSSGWWTSRNYGIRSQFGDSGTDIMAYYDYVLVTLNGSNLLEICKRNGEHHKAVEIPACRRIAASGDFAYISSYADDGYVAKVHIEKGLLAGTCATGHEPEGLAIIGNKLYALNSCGYHTDYSGNGNNEEASISVIDLNTFTEVERVNLGIINAYSSLTVMPDGHSLFINSSGDYNGVAPKSIIFDTATLTVTKEFPQGGTYSTVYRGELYVFDTAFSYETYTTEVSGFVYDIFTDTVFEFPIKAEALATITAPSGIWIHPTEGEVYIADKGDFTTPGQLFRFDLAGTLKEKYSTGVCPSQLAWDLR